MDRLFVNKSKSKSKSKKNKKPSSTEYFPRNGGSGTGSVPSGPASVTASATTSVAGSASGSVSGSVSGSATQSRNGSIVSSGTTPASEKFPIYEPAEIMNDTDFTVPEDESLRSDIQRAIRRVAIRNKSETDSLSDGRIRMETVSDTSEPVLDKRIDADQYYKNYPFHTGVDMTKARGTTASSPATPASPGSSESNAGHAANPEPVSVSQSSIVINKNDIVASIINAIRELSRRSFVLLPVDNIMTSYPQSKPAILFIETFCLMLAADVLAKGVQLVCKPAVWLLHLILYFFK